MNHAIVPSDYLHSMQERISVLEEKVTDLAIQLTRARERVGDLETEQRRGARCRLRHNNVRGQNRYRQLIREMAHYIAR